MKLITRCRQCPVSMKRPLGSKIIAPLMWWLYHYEICFTCAKREHRWNRLHIFLTPSWFRFRRWCRQLLCSHQWLWLANASGGTFMHFKRYGNLIGIPAFDPALITDWYYCDKCHRSKKTVSPKDADYQILIDKIAQKVRKANSLDADITDEINKIKMSLEKMGVI